MKALALTLAAILLGAVALEAGPPLVGCGIKGNISVRTGERIYHMPGQKLLPRNTDQLVVSRRAMVLLGIRRPCFRAAR
jgi:hypothetical protein